MPSNTPFYGSITSYQNSPGGFVAFIKFDLSPGGNYEIQYSTDGGITWTLVYPYSVPAGTNPSLANLTLQLAVPGGIPVRMVQK